MNAKQNYKWNELTMGTCYYPEHWDKKQVPIVSSFHLLLSGTLG